ncbi:MAG: FeoA family protein [Lachnospiraceae bacterium]|nr:FeoA family protein [Lachnospiraceae bacterium]
MQSLSEIRAGEACTIKWMLGNVSIMEFLRSRNMKEGSLVRVLQQRNNGTIIRMDDRRFALGREVAERIKV